MINYTYFPIKTQFINQSSNYQPFSVKVGFLPRFQDLPTDIFINKPIPRVRSSSYRGGVILIDLKQSIAQTRRSNLFGWRRVYFGWKPTRWRKKTSNFHTCKCILCYCRCFIEMCALIPQRFDNLIISYDNVCLFQDIGLL